MRMRWPFSVFFVTGFLCFHLISFSQDIHFNLVTRTPENAGIVLGMTQDAQGLLWFATGTGLFRYDGYRYASYQFQPKNPNSLASNYIECLATSKEGFIWLGVQGFGLDCLDPATGLFTHFRHNDNDPGSLTSDTVNVIIQDRDGILWIGTVNGLDKFDPGTNKFFHYKREATNPSSISCNLIRSIYEDKQGIIWVGTGSGFDKEGPGNEGGLNKLNKKTGTFTRYMHDEKDPNSLIDNRVRAIFEDSRGNFWIGTAGDGLHTMDRAKGIFERHPYDPLRPEKLSRPLIGKTIPYGFDHITFITEDNKQRIWIGTFEGGINVYDPTTQKVSHYGTDSNSNQKLNDNHFWSVCKTRDDILWISTWENKLYKINPHIVNLPYIRTGSPIFDFAEDDAHELWMGSQSVFIHREHNGKHEKFPFAKKPGQTDNPLLFIKKDHAKFWITTFQGLYHFDPVTKTLMGYHHEPGNANSLGSDTVFALSKTKDSQLLISTNAGLDLMDLKTGTFKHFQNDTKDTESINNQAIAIHVDKNQNVWLGSANGLDLLNVQTGKSKKYLKQSGIYYIMEDKSGTMWVSTTSGLYKYQRKTDNFLFFTDASSVIPANNVYGIAEDSVENLWIATNKGIIKIDKERAFAVLYGRSQGVNGIVLTGFIKCLQNGEIVASDTAGYYDFHPELLRTQVSAPIVSVSNFLLNNKAIQPSPYGILSVPLMQTKEIHLKHDQNTLSFELANIDFSSEHDETRLLYMLQNYDDEWRIAGDERRAYYFNLPAGKYIFKVKALNAAGISDEKDINIIITPPWWSTWWAYCIFVLLGAGLLRSYIVFRSRKLKRENKILEERVARRTDQLNQSLENLKATQTQLIQSEKMASLGELTAGIAHEIQNPLNFVNNFSEVNAELIDDAGKEIDSGNMSELKTIFNNIRDNEKKIIHHGRRADSIVKSMLLHSRRNNGVKEPTDINALADEYLKLSYHGLRAKDKSFNATLQTDFDETIPEINIIAQDIARVLVNLYNNAFYAVSEKKALQSGSFEPTVYVHTRQAGTRVEIHVRDNGSGISKDVIEKIFQPFFTTKPAGQGTGLGLSLSYDIIKAHGGDLNVETKEGEWTEFTIILPS